MTLLLMAAGRGSRYGKLKQYDELGPMREFLMEFSIYDALENGFDHIVIVTQKDKIDFIREYLSKRLPKNIKLDVVAQELTDLPEGSSFSGERIKPWGTAHAVWVARNLINSSFVVINADDHYGKNAYKNVAEFMKNTEQTNQYGLVAYTLKDTLSAHGSVSRGVCKVADRKLVSIIERIQIEEKNNLIKDLDSGVEFTGEELVSMNFWICKPVLFEEIEDYLKTFLTVYENIKNNEIHLPFVIQESLNRGKATVEIIPSESSWFGVTYASDKEIAVSFLENMTGQKAYKSPLWNIDEQQKFQ